MLDIVAQARRDANADVEHNAVLVEGTPEVVLHTLDPDEHLVEVPIVSESWSVAAKAIGKALAGFPAPAPHCLLGDGNNPLGQERLNIPQAEAEHVIQPHNAHRQTKPHLPGAPTRFAFSDLGQVVQSAYLDLLLGKYASAWHYGHKKQADDARRALGGNPR